MISPEEFQTLVERSQKFLSDDDFRRLLVSPKIIKYSELESYKTLEELLPNNTDYVIILVESKKNVGHWVCMMRKGNMITEFDSYGSRIDHELDFITRMVKRLLGENRREIARLETASPKFTVTHNKMRLQSNKPLDETIPEPATCGRWCAAVIQYHLMGYTLEEFQAIIRDKSHEKFDDMLPLDLIVCVMCPSP